MLDLVGYVDDQGSSDELLARLGTSRLGGIDVLCNGDARVGDDVGYVIAIGAGEVRRTIDERLTAAGRRALTLVHPMATVGGDNRIAEGCILTAGARVTTNITLGRHTQLHVNSTIGHDSVLDDFVSVYPGRHGERQRAPGRGRHDRHRRERAAGCHRRRRRVRGCRCGGDRRRRAGRHGGRRPGPPSPAVSAMTRH